MSYLLRVKRTNDPLFPARPMRPSFIRGLLPYTDSWKHDQELIQPALLRRWAHLTLNERVARINRKYNLNRGKAHTLLGLFYRRHGIVYRKTYISYQQEVVDSIQLTVERKDFALKMRDALLANTVIWYADETSFNAW